MILEIAMKLLIGILFLFLSLTSSFGQNLVLIDTAKQEVQQNIKTTYQEKVSEQLKKIKKNYSGKVGKEISTVYSEFSESFMDQIDQGNFAYNEEYQKLFDDILAKLADRNPEYSEEIENTNVLLSYGQEPNAYAIGNRIIVIYVPLLKSIANEYELAFILSHELSHNILDHSLQGTVSRIESNYSKSFIKKTRQLKRQKYNKGLDARKAYRNTIYAYTGRTREQEQEADHLGFELFSKAYPNQAYDAVKSLQLLDEIDKETDSLSSSDFKNILGTEKTPLRKDLINNELLNKYHYEKSSKFWEIDSLKTHPDSRARAAYIIDNFDVDSTATGIPSEDFKRLKLSSNFNDVLGLYQLEAYGQSLYQALILSKQYSDNTFLNDLIVKNLQKIDQAKKSYEISKYVSIPSPYDSDSYNTFLYVVRELRNREMKALINHYKTRI